MRPEVILLLAVFLFAFSARADELDLLNRQFLEYYAGTGSDLGSARVQNSLSHLESATASFTAAGFLLSDGSWTDIQYGEIPTGQWSPWEHFRRLMTMARAYNTPGQRFYRDQRLRGQIEAALRTLPTFYGTGTATPGNWWFWVIGPALDLGPTLVLMKDDLPAEVIDQSTQILSARIGPAPGLTPSLSILDGQNLVWSGLNHYSLGLLLGDSERLGRVRDLLSAMGRPHSGEQGLQHDASFQQHGPQLYTGGYGGSYGLEMSKYLLLTRGTSYSLSLSGHGSVSFADFAMDGIAWSLYHNYFDVSVIGREVVKPWTNGYNGLATLLQMSEVPSPRQAEIAGAAKKMLSTWSDALPLELAVLAARIERGTGAGSWPSGHRHYFVSDYTVQRRPGFFASVKMLSKRTRSGERTNNENLLGSRQSDGRFHLVLRGDEYAKSEAWAAMDWSRLPGVTVEQRPAAASANYGMGTRSFVGGAGDGRGGVSAMDFAAVDSALTAKKGWVFFDDSIVFFVNSVTSLSGNPVETIVDQRPMSSLAAPLTIDGTNRQYSVSSLHAVRWIASDGIGYAFPRGEDVELRRENRSGSWSALGGPADLPQSIVPISTMIIDHGVNPIGGSAEYIIVPGVTGAAMSLWVASNPITILRNDETASAARDNRTGALGVVFWTAGAVEGISADTPIVLYQTVQGTRMELSLADPAQGTGTYRVTLPRRALLAAADPGVNLTQGLRTTTLTVPKNSGRTVHVSLTLGAPRTRGVRR